MCYGLRMDIAGYLYNVVTVLAEEIGVRSYQDHDRLRKAADFIAGQLDIVRI